MNSERLPALRREKGKSQAQVAQELGLGYKRYNHYETGRREPNPELLKKMANYFEVSTDYLLGNEAVLAFAKADLKDLLSVEGLLFDGVPMTPQERKSVLDAVETGLSLARRKGS